MAGNPERAQQHSFEEVRACDLCGSDRFTREFTINDCTLVKCRGCGLVFTSPRYSAEHLAEIYKGQYYENAPSYLSCQLQEPPEDLYNLAAALKKMVSPGNGIGTLRALDVGCGGGTAVAAFKKAGWHAVGIDLNETAINAGRRIGLDLHVRDIGDVEPGSFDAVTLFHVLEHVSNPKQFLHRCASALARGGILVIDVPNYGSRNARRLREHWPNLYPHLHLYQFTPATLRAYLASPRLDEIRMRKVSGYGPAEDYHSVPGAHLRPRNRIKEALQASRHALYLVPGAKAFLRWLVWQVLGYGECMRVLCRKNW